MKIKKNLILIAISIGYFASISSKEPLYKKMINKPYNERILELKKLHRRLNQLDSLQRVQKIREIKNYAKHHHDRALFLNMELYIARRLIKKEKKIEEGLNQLAIIIDNAEKEKIYIIEIKALHNRGNFYWHSQKYQKAFKDYIKLSEVLKNVTPAKYPNKVRDLFFIARAYYYFHDYEEALKYLYKATAIPGVSAKSRYLANVINTIGLCYRAQGNLERAIYYFKKVYTGKPENIKSSWGPIAMGNIGSCYLLQKKYKKALPFVLIELKGAQKREHRLDIGMANLSLAKIRIYNGQLEKGWEHLQIAKKYISTSPKKERYYYDVHKVTSDYYLNKNKPRLAHIYLDSSYEAYKNYQKDISALKIRKAQQEVNEKRKKIRNIQFHLEQQQYIVSRNRWLLLLISVALGVVIFSFTLIRRSLKKNLQLKSAELSLRKSEKELTKFTIEVAEKNRHIKELQKEINVNTKNKTFNTLREHIILTDDDWRRFRLLFEDVYPGFVDRLKKEYPELSPSLIRFMILSKLNLSNKEMANMLGVSPNSLQVAKHRIYKKLNLDSNTTIHDFLKNI